MSNQQLRNVIAPSEYERNRAAISNYRQYLDLYERLNEQGLKNHEEVERIEMLLQQRVQAGEEAKRQLELLKQTTGIRRLTDGGPAVPDLAAMAPPTPPVTLTAPQTSSSAYIEEVHQEQLPPPTSSYRPYAAPHPMHSSTIPPPSYVPPAYSSTSQNVPQYNQQLPPGAPTSHSHAHPVMQAPSNLGQQPQNPQQFRYYHPHVHEQPHYPRSKSNSTPAQPEYSQNYPSYSHPSRQTAHPNTGVVLQHQTTTHQQNPPPQGSASHQQNNRNQVPNVQQATTQMVSTTRNPEASSISRPKSLSATRMTSSVKVSSSLDGALGEVTACKTQSPDVPAIPPSTSVVQPSDSGSQSRTDATRNSTNTIQLPLPSTPASNVVPQPSSSLSSAPGQPPSSTSSSSVPVVKQTPSLVRTPKQADKAHLARDLLRALKRPRPDISPSSVIEPEPKRHASDLVIKPTVLLAPTSSSNMQTSQPTTPIPIAPSSTQKSSLSIQTARPIASTSIAAPSTLRNLPSVEMVQPIVPTSSALALTPPTVAATPGPVAASTTTQGMTSTLPSQTTIPYTSWSSSTSAPPDAFSRSVSSTLGFLVRSPVNPGTSTGIQPSGSLQSSGETRQSQPSQTNAPAKDIPVPKEKPTNASAVKSSNTSPAQEGSLVLQPQKTEDRKPSPAVIVQGPSVATPSSVHPPPQKDPLFLPSPTSSPAPGSAVLALEPSLSSPSSARVEHKRDATWNVGGSKLVFDYVEVPPLPAWVKKWKARQNRSSEMDELDTFRNVDGVSISRSPSLGDFSGLQLSSTSSPAFKDVDVGDDEESIEEEEDQPFGNYDEAEQQVLHEHCSLLRESFCRWDKCEVVLNAPGSLLRHVRMVHQPRRISAESPWTCLWAGCGYTVTARDDYKQHVEKHAVFPLRCPFKGCTENFRTPRQCIKHKRSDHDGNAVLRQTATPLTVSSHLTASMPKIPKMFPAYMTEFVRPASIPKHRHETLMISVRRRISGNVPAHLQRYNAARPMPATPSAKDAEPPNNTPYSFLEHRSTRYSSYLSSPVRSKNFQPLHSSYVTNLAKRGLVLWPDEGNNDALPEAMMEELERIPMEEDAVEEELLMEEGFDVFGPTICIQTPSAGGGNGESR